MIHKAWNSKEGMPYCFSSSFVKFQGHMGQKIANLYPIWAFPDCNSSLNSPMDLKWCKKLNVSDRPVEITQHVCRIRYLGRYIEKLNQKTPVIQYQDHVYVVTISTRSWVSICFQTIMRCINLSTLWSRIDNVHKRDSWIPQWITLSMYT